jgi:toxin ParE1/3/4
MKRLRLTSLAQNDYLEAVIYYEERQPGLAKEFEDEAAKIFARITNNPEHFGKATPTVRKARMPRFEHGIYFTVEKDEIGVLAIYHPSRNPDALRTRF